MDRTARRTARSTTSAETRRDARREPQPERQRTERPENDALLHALPDLEVRDQDGDLFHVEDAYDGDLMLNTSRRDGSDDAPVLLNISQALAVYHWLGDWLMAQQGPPATAEPVDPTCDRADHLTSSCEHGEPQTITAEAEAAVYGDREDDYGHPRLNWTRTAILWTGLLHHKLADGEHIDAEDVGRLNIAAKLSRDVNDPKRDNRVDMAGYALGLDRLETGR